MVTEVKGQVDFPNPHEQESIGLENVQSFDELYQLLRENGDIQGTAKDYTPERMIQKIEGVRHGHVDISFITRSYGLREAVTRLLGNNESNKN